MSLSLYTRWPTNPVNPELFYDVWSNTLSPTNSDHIGGTCTSKCNTTFAPTAWARQKLQRLTCGPTAPSHLAIGEYRQGTLTRFYAVGDALVEV